MVISATPPAWQDKTTQTTPQKTLPPKCVPLLMLDEDKKKLYCYHGGKCLCDTCRKIHQDMKEDMDRNYDEFISHDRLNLKPTIRHATRLPYRLKASRVSEEMADMLLKHHLQLLKDYPIYYIDKTYYKKCVYMARGPQEVGTQTETRIGRYGIAGCPCPNKSVCWDI